ncbi:MAG: phosphoribosylamine--glycine ligase [Deltaproteobacteria bacterium]|nr:phosphoribosylamine--glycine ligase [Deltaproteobacteria bacterium]
MKILVIGNGGREHALLWKLQQSPLVTQLFCAPGNGGTAEIAQNVDIPIHEIKKLKLWALDQKIDFTVVGPEIPLSLGIVDAFQKSKLSIFGVNQKAAQLESSKVFSKRLLQKYDLPTAQAQIFDSYSKASSYISQAAFPLVIKADGLAGGKGVRACKNQVEAKKALKEIMEEKLLGDSGASVVIEEFLEGEEVSYLGLLDGKIFLPFPASQDHKRALDGDLGLNTGGMGAYSPVPWFDEVWQKKIQKIIVKPLLKAFKSEGISYRGILYIGLLISQGKGLRPKGRRPKPYVLEFNVRFGDPEAQVLLFRLKSDLLPLLQATSQGRLKGMEFGSSTLEWDPHPAVCVVMVSGGYPEAYQTGYEVLGLKTLPQDPDVALFHAATVLRENKVLTQGGRVLNVVAKGKDFEEAVQKAYACVHHVQWPYVFFRKDIGARVCPSLKLRS